jgi:hypothetical protein
MKALIKGVMLMVVTLAVAFHSGSANAQCIVGGTQIPAVPSTSIPE